MEDDAAHINMGGNWRIPTFDDFKELVMNTDVYLVPLEGEDIQGTAMRENELVIIEWSSKPSLGDIKGAKFYKKDDKQTYLFVPAVGGVNEGEIQLVEQVAFLWSSSLYALDNRNGWFFVALADNGNIGYDVRCDGVPIRGVMEQ